ncbi:MAG: TIGR01777 family protein [Armatimonadetes bacterium]|nr:TIGR01777 family protein [Armatimonadota bacterium]
MKILVSGATGLVGSKLTLFLTVGGHEAVPLRRGKAGANGVRWDPEAGTIDEGALEGFDAVVHLAGENIAQRWTPEAKKRICDSRVRGTQLLAGAVSRLERPPKVMVSASAIGYYGDRGDETLREDSGPGKGFLADVACEWEAATTPASESGIRVAILRFGIVLTPEGGALAKMLLPFRLGAGGNMGSGRQYWSWVSMNDLIGSISHALATEALQGPVNAVSPHPATNAEFTRTLSRVLGRPAFFHAPALALRLVLGEMADALLLSSARVEPSRLLATGYTFRYPVLEEALRHALSTS